MIVVVLATSKPRSVVTSKVLPEQGQTDLKIRSVTELENKDRVRTEKSNVSAFQLKT